MLVIEQTRYHVANETLYHLTSQAPLCETISERQLKFTGHCIHILTDEPANRFVIYEYRIRSSLQPGVSRTTYFNRILLHILHGENRLGFNEIKKMVVLNLNGTNFLSCLIRKSLRTDLLSPNDDDDDDVL